LVSVARIADCICDVSERFEGIPLVKVAAYHSSKPSDPEVHHDQHDCPTGQEIPARHVASGMGGYRKCDHCVTGDDDVRVRPISA
jgi:hypothetical protein